MSIRTLTALTTAFALAHASWADEEVDPKAKVVCAAWKERQDTLPAVRYRYTVESWYAAAPKFDLPEKKSTSRWVVLIDVKNGRYRFESLKGGKEGFKKTISVFNGKELQHTTYPTNTDGEILPNSLPEVIIGRGDFSNVPTFEGGLEQPLLVSHGLVSLSGQAMARPGNIPFLPDASNLFFHHSKRAGGGAIDSYRTFPFSSLQSFAEYDTDTSRRNIVVGYRQMGGKPETVSQAVTLAYSRKDGHNIMSSYKFELFQGSSCKLRHATVGLEAEILPNVPDSDFSLSIAEGQHVTVQEFKKGGKPLEPNITSTQAEYRDGSLKPVGGDAFALGSFFLSHLWWWVALGLTAILGGVGGWWYVRRTRHRHNNPVS